jgi:hypothetical protein
VSAEPPLQLIDALIERSSFGERSVRQLRARTPAAIVEMIVARTEVADRRGILIRPAHRSLHHNQACPDELVRREETEPMSDNLKIRGPADRSRVNVNETWEVAYWCRELGCTESDLRRAVNAVGPMVANVRRHLGK